MARDDQKVRSEQVRQAILDTAMEMGIQEGFDEISIRKITQKMKYSTGVVYHHFKERQEIIDAIEEDQSARLNAIISEVQDETKDVLYNMKATFHRVMRLAYEEPELYNLIVLRKYSRRTPEKPRWLGYLSGYLKKGMEAGLIRTMDPEKAAFSVWSSFLGFNLMVSRLRALPWEEVEVMFQVQSDMMLHGIAQQKVSS
jgi:AcrR family transcriptional regulator